MSRRSSFSPRFVGVLATALALMCSAASVVVAQNDSELQRSYSIARRNQQDFSRLEVYPTVLTYEVRKGRINLPAAFVTHQVDNDVAIQEQALFAAKLLTQGYSTAVVQKEIDQHFAQMRTVSADRRSSKQRKASAPKELPENVGNILDTWPERLPHGYGTPSGRFRRPQSSREGRKPPNSFYGEIITWPLPAL